MTRLLRHLALWLAPSLRLEITEAVLWRERALRAERELRRIHASRTAHYASESLERWGVN